MGAIATDVVQVCPAVGDEPVPLEQNGLVERDGCLFVKIDHHFGDASLGGRSATEIAPKAKVPTDRRLDTVAVEGLALNR